MNVSWLTSVQIERKVAINLLKRFFQSTISSKMPVKVGDSVPNVDLYEDNPTNKVNIANLSSGKKIILFAVPGAFTPGCSKTHLPGYLKLSEELKQKGINEIVCVSVNDPFVTAAWAKDQNAVGKVRILADPQGAFTKAVDLGKEIAPLGGFRSLRYSMVIEDGKITSLQVEPDGTGLSCSLAENLKL
ncbi:peroxiredoxin-5, mitochondrial [Agrilus planipennis]|uniref:Peroxiredoxin-5 n=1 Tax=Agrilus planipennis TaxID=224129 RepID=A0A1W4WS39_AGRPL|nr:peroxiredoxin-5, mitochondrial [Agrilus planipennis]